MKLLLLGLRRGEGESTVVQAAGRRNHQLVTELPLYTKQITCYRGNTFSNNSTFLAVILIGESRPTWREMTGGGGGGGLCKRGRVVGRHQLGVVGGSREWRLW